MGLAPGLLALSWMRHAWAGRTYVEQLIDKAKTCLSRRSGADLCCLLECLVNFSGAPPSSRVNHMLIFFISSAGFFISSGGSSSSGAPPAAYSSPPPASSSPPPALPPPSAGSPQELERAAQGQVRLTPKTRFGVILICWRGVLQRRVISDRRRRDGHVCMGAAASRCAPC